MHNWLIEESANFVRLFCLPQDPHKLSHDSLCSHAVCFNQIITFFHIVAHLIDCHITSFMGNLCGHDDCFALCEKIMNCFFKTGIAIRRKSTNSKAFDNNCIIVLSNILQNIRIDTGNQSQHEDIWIQIVIERWDFFLNDICNIGNYFVITYNSDFREINALQWIFASR